MARALGASLGVIVVRKLGVPYQRELAMDAIGEDGARVINLGIVRHAGVNHSELRADELSGRGELRRRLVR